MRSTSRIEIALACLVAAGCSRPAKTPAERHAAAKVALVLASSAHGANATRWLTVAVDAGSPHAMFLLGNAYHAGAGVPHDDGRALALYQRAAELEDAAALQTLALAYTVGDLGLPQDPDLARQLAAEAEHALAHVADQ